MTIKDKIVEFMRESAYSPMLEEELINSLDIDSKQKKTFSKLLVEMEQEGLIIRTRKKRFGVPERMGLIVGRLESHSRGYGFVISELEEVRDVFIPSNFMNGAMHRDKVIARISNMGSDTKKCEGEIIRILERTNYEIVGTYEDSRNFGFVVPDDTKLSMDIFIPKGERNGAKTGSKVVCEISKWPEARRNPEGRITEILGEKGDVGTDILAIMRQYKLDPDFPEEVINEVNEISEDISQEELNRRTDLRDLKMVTIDGADAKDLDDAVSVEKLPNGNFRLGVHIADVAHYVRENTELDKEAVNRATSVYLVDRVIPMLPKKLSNGVCSLNPHINRLTLTCFMEIDENGKVVNHEILESVININERMIYEDVSNMLEKGDSDLLERYKDLVDDFRTMEELFKILNKRRDDRGAIDFDFPESKVVLDKKGKPIEIKKYERRVANRIIEEFMLVCNETISEHFHWLSVPFVYRIHEEPSMERIEEFNKFIHNFGYHLKGLTEEVHPKALQDLLKKIEGKKEEVVINTLMLRSLRKARYSPANLGHFGLAANYYSHFTSPIRRYPDLMIHRIIKEHLQGKLTKKRSEKLKSTVSYISDQSSARERIADDAERDTVDLKKAEYMQERIGEVFDGIVSGITSFGMFVELENTIEGMVRLSSLVDDYYNYNSDHHTLTGERTKKTYRIGDEVTIQVARVDIMQKEIDFNLIDKK